MAKVKLSFVQNYFYQENMDVVCVKTRHTSAADTPPLHSHTDFYELIVATGGTAIHQVNGRVSRLTPGNVLLIKPGHFHEFREFDNLTIFNLLFTEKLLALFSSDLCSMNGGQLIFNMPQEKTAPDQISDSGIRICDAKYSEILELLEKMDRQKLSHDPGIRMLILSEFIQVLFLLGENCVWSGSSTLKTRYLQQITIAMKQMRKNIQQPWTLKQLAGIANMSVSAFCREFKSITGMPPIDYLIHLKVSRGARLLRLNSNQICLNEIAWQCGFQDANYFSRQFKRIFRETPLKFAKASHHHFASEPH